MSQEYHKKRSLATDGSSSSGHAQIDKVHRFGAIFRGQHQADWHAFNLQLPDRHAASLSTLASSLVGIVRWEKGRWQPISRGGSWERGGRFCRAAYRGYHAPDNRHNYCGLLVILVVE